MGTTMKTFRLPPRALQQLEFISGWTGQNATATTIAAIEALYEQYHAEMVAMEDDLRRISAEAAERGAAEVAGRADALLGQPRDGTWARAVYYLARDWRNDG